MSSHYINLPGRPFSKTQHFLVTDGGKIQLISKDYLDVEDLLSPALLAYIQKEVDKKTITLTQEDLF